MSFITLTEAKKQLNILEADTFDDTYIQHLIEVAEQVVANYVNYPLSDYTNETLPKPIKHGILLIIAQFYVNREPVSFAQGYKIPHTIELLLDPIRNFNV